MIQYPSYSTFHTYVGIMSKSLEVDTSLTREIRNIAICYRLLQPKVHISDLVSLLLCFIVCRR